MIHFIKKKNLYRLNRFLKIKKYLFFIIFLIYATLHNIFFYSINFMCVNFYYKFILINKFIKHNQINDPCCNIKYIDLYLCLSFSSFVFIYR